MNFPGRARLRTAHVPVLLLAGVLAACGRGDREDRPAPADSLTAPPPRDTAAGGPAEGGTVGSGEPATGSAAPRETTSAAGQPSPTPLATPATAPRSASLACRDSLESTFARPEKAIWPARPDTVQPLPEGRYRILGQVRPDSLTAGLTYLCVVQEAGGRWTVVELKSSAE